MRYTVEPTEEGTQTIGLSHRVIDSQMPPCRVAFCTNQYDAERIAAALNADEQQRQPNTAGRCCRCGLFVMQAGGGK